MEKTKAAPPRKPEVEADIRTKLKRRALRVFEKLDTGAVTPSTVRQHKLRRVKVETIPVKTEAQGHKSIQRYTLVYDWHGGRGGGQFFAVRRDLAKRVFISGLDSLPEEEGTATDKLYVAASGRHGTPNV
jgi:hypothetical protein